MFIIYAYNRLLLWVQIKIPHITITNFTSDWKDGKAIGALINAIAPGLCADYRMCSDSNSLSNTIESMTLAKNWLGIEMFILPEELVNGNVTEKCLIIYLNQFTTAKLRSGAPLRAKRCSNRFLWNSSNVEIVFIFLYFLIKRQNFGVRTRNSSVWSCCSNSSQFYG